MCCAVPLLLSQSLLHDHFYVGCEVCVSLFTLTLLCTISYIPAVDRAAFRGDLCMLASPELCPSQDDFDSTLQSLLEKSSQSAC